MKDGNLVNELPKLDEIQQYYLDNIKILPENYKKLKEVKLFKLIISKRLNDLTNSLKKKYI